MPAVDDVHLVKGPWSGLPCASCRGDIKLALAALLHLMDYLSQSEELCRTSSYDDCTLFVYKDAKGSEKS